MSTFLNQLGSQIAILRQDLSCQKPSQTSALPEVSLSKFYDLDKGIKDYLGEEADLPLDNLTLLKNLRRNGNVFASESLFQKNLQAAVENGFLMLSVEELKKHIHVSGEEPSSEQEQAFVALKVRRFLELTSEKRMAHHLRLSQNPSDLPTLSNRITDLENKISGSTGIYGFDDKYTGAGIGDGGTFSLFNTLASARQVVFALAFSSHPLVIMVIEDEGINPSNFCGEDFVANQILDGLKVLELGCGQIPTHARILRAMGAQVFTVDLQPESTFKKLPHDPKICREEREHHLQLHLDRKEAISLIGLLFGNDFHLITYNIQGPCAPLSMGALLLEGGVMGEDINSGCLKMKFKEKMVSYSWRGKNQSPIYFLNAAPMTNSF